MFIHFEEKPRTPIKLAEARPYTLFRFADDPLPSLFTKEDPPPLYLIMETMGEKGDILITPIDMKNPMTRRSGARDVVTYGYRIEIQTSCLKKRIRLNATTPGNGMVVSFAPTEPDTAEKAIEIEKRPAYFVLHTPAKDFRVALLPTNGGPIEWHDNDIFVVERPYTIVLTADTSGD